MVSNPNLEEQPTAKQLLKSVLLRKDHELIKQRTLDAYYFLRYLITLLKLFVPILLVVMPILVPLNYIDGRGQDLDPSSAESSETTKVMGLDTLDFGNISRSNTNRYVAHLVCALLVTAWFCYISYVEMCNYERESCINISQIFLKDAKYQDMLVSSLDGSFACSLDQKLQKRDKCLAKLESATMSLLRRDPLTFKSCARIEQCRTALCESENGVDEFIRGRILPLGGFCWIPKCKWCAIVKSSWHNIVWSNVGLAQWKRLLRSISVAIVLTMMIVLWAVPVSSTAALSQLDSLVRGDTARLFFERHPTWKTLASSVAGMLPGAALALMLRLLPPLLEVLSRIYGAQFRAEQAAFVQKILLHLSLYAGIPRRFFRFLLHSISKAVPV